MECIVSNIKNMAQKWGKAVYTNRVLECSTSYTSSDLPCPVGFAEAWLQWTLRLLRPGTIRVALVSGFIAGPSKCLNASSVGRQYSGCVLPLFWSGNVASAGNWPDHTHNSHWDQGQFAPLSSELSFLQSLCITVQDGDRPKKGKNTVLVNGVKGNTAVFLGVKIMPRHN